MIKRGLALTLVLGMASIAQAGAVLEMVPSSSSDPSFNPCGYYDPGEVVTVEFFLSQSPPDVDQELRMIHLRFDGTNPDLGLGDFAWDAVAFAVGHYLDDEPGALAAGVSSTYYYEDPGDLGPNPAAQLTLPGDGTAVSIGTMDVTMPGAAGDYVLDASNGVISFGFELVPPADPITFWSVGDSLTLHVIDQALQVSTPADQYTLWRTAKNCVLLEFDTDLGAVGPIDLTADVVIHELQAGGAFGFNLAPNFNYEILNDGGGNPRVLMIQDQAGNLTHRTWYGFQNVTWGAVPPFVVQFAVNTGDADGNRFTNPMDVGLVNGNQGMVPVDERCSCRFDIDGNGFVNPMDVGLANGHQGGFVQKPTGHDCE